MEKPISFFHDMVKAILKGRKIQTRRPIKPPEEAAGFFIISAKNGSGKWPIAHDEHEQMFNDYMNCPYGQLGDILWVRETWRKVNGKYYYYLDNWNQSLTPTWQSNYSMPREAARIILKVRNVRVERLQDISEEDAIYEGFDGTSHFLKAWDSIYLNTKYIRSNNPWVWVVEFEVCN